MAIWHRKIQEKSAPSNLFPDAILHYEENLKHELDQEADKNPAGSNFSCHNK